MTGKQTSGFRHHSKVRATRFGRFAAPRNGPGFVVAVGDTLQEAVERADRGCREISIRYADGTTHHAAELVEFRELAHS